MAIRPPRTANGDSFPIWPAGGLIERVVLSVGTWTEFVPTAGIDAWLVQTPVTQGRIVRTSTATHPDLAPGTAVTPAHLERSIDVFPGQDALGLDVDTGCRFLFALVDAPVGSTAAMLFEGAV